MVESLQYGRIEAPAKESMLLDSSNGGANVDVMQVGTCSSPLPSSLVIWCARTVRATDKESRRKSSS